AVDFKCVFKILNKIAADTSNINVKMTEIDTKLDSMDKRFDEIESRILTLEDHREERSSKMADMEKKMTEGLGSRPRHNNICLMGLPEGVENSRPIDFLKTLPVLLDLPEGEDLEIEWAHRSLALKPKPKPTQHPRPIIMRLLKFQTRELILQQAQEKQIITWENHRLAFFQDLSKEVQQKRKAFVDCKRNLRDHAVKYLMAYPATLRIHHEGQWHSFPTP
uniref:L1 transposable element RRM domain-containing protein n=1 Tax=Latimeria chalumnae TaxID=7897 RepID=H3A1H1_LATCH